MGEKVLKLPQNPSRYGWGSWDLMLEVLRKGVERGPWVLGERFSAADVLVGSSAHYMRMFGVLTDDPVIFAYADRCLARPAYQRALAMEARG
jgi:glutathione S-transferase